MNTSARAFMPMAALALCLGGCATTPSPTIAQTEPMPAFSLQSGRHLRIVSGYLRKGPNTVVRGVVSRDPLWSGPIYGHLHVTAFGPDGTMVARQPTVWQGRFTADHPETHPYQADLRVPRTSVARVEMSLVAGPHTELEFEQ